MTEATPPVDDRRRSGRVVVVSGGGGGIGEAIVTRFLANGDLVTATDRSASSLGGLRDRAEHPDRLTTTVADVTAEKDCENLAAELRGRTGRVDVLVNCAGYFPIARFEEISVAEWEQVVAVNLTGTFLMTRSLLPLMKEQGWGRIVNVASSSVFTGVTGRAHYVAAKAGVIGLGRTLALELGPHGITVNAVAPGLTMTAPIRDSMTAERIERSREGRALERDQEPEDVAGPVFFLASPEAAFVSGQTLTIDGGKVMS